MYVYRILNLINKKAYIGITNDFNKRMSNHRCGDKQLIDLAIQKYGPDNFLYEILLSDLSIAEAERKEQEYIIFYDTKVPNGYNVAKGGGYVGHYLPKDSRIGLKNSNSRLTEYEVRFIKDHRDLPQLLLYQLFKENYNEEYSYEAFLKVYNDQTYKDIPATVEKYPYNKSFSGYLVNSKFTINELINLRKQYANLVPWETAYQPYKERVTWDSFWQIYNGYGAKGKLFMPFIFTEELKKAHTKIKGLKYQGELNPKAKLTKDQVISIREQYDNGISFQELYKMFPFVTPTTIRQICHRETWKHIA